LKKKIAILGGGISSLTAAYDITREPNWQDKYDMTVYQMGWRLGGKGASSRNPNRHYRIEEHGLHIWLGFYENAFSLMRACYSELSGVPGVFRSWQDAFKPHSFVVLEEKTTNGWLHWPTTFPVNDSLPGDGSELPTMWDYLVMALEWLADAFEQRQSQIQSDIHVKVSPLSEAIVGEELTSAEQTQRKTATKLIRAAQRRARKLSHRGERLNRVREVQSPLDDFSAWLGTVLQTDLAHDTGLRRLFVPIDIFAGVARGILADNAIAKGFDSLDEFEFQEWLARHGASPISLESAWLRGAYDLAFSFEDGDSNKPNLAAGASLRALFRMVFTYKGAVLWKMQAGMGETVFTPLYKVLHQRGVKFRFFHKVRQLYLSTDKHRVEEVSINLQATVKGEEYVPLERVGMWDCWRFAPDYEQLAEGQELLARQVNLESNWSGWSGVEEIRLQAGVDFDDVILGIPIAALSTICAELIEASEDWRQMMAHVKTIQTQGFQLWLNKSLAECGWPMESPVLGAYVEPLDTWADMTHLLTAELWPLDSAPKQLAYFCGVMPDAPATPSASDLGFPAKESELARARACSFLANHAGYLWPSALTPHSTQFDWDILVGTDTTGEGRFADQYWHPNIDPSERYTLAVAGSTRFRLRADGSGFQNLVLAGDWLHNGLNTPGCIESAVISGRQAARAITGSQDPIIGESDFPRERGLLSKICGFLLGWLPHIVARIPKLWNTEAR